MNKTTNPTSCQYCDDDHAQMLHREFGKHGFYRMMCAACGAHTIWFERSKDALNGWNDRGLIIPGDDSRKMQRHKANVVKKRRSAKT